MWRHRETRLVSRKFLTKQKSAQEHAKCSLPGFPHLIMAFWLFYFILLLFFFTGREWLWVDHFARHMGGGEGEEPWSWPVEMFSVETRFEGLPVLGALHVCKNCPNCQKKGYFRANSDSVILKWDAEFIKQSLLTTEGFLFPDGETWICKPTGMNQGKGIYLVSSKEQLKEKLNINGESESSARRSVVRPPQGRVIQRYK